MPTQNSTNGTTVITLAGSRGIEQNMIAHELRGVADGLAKSHLCLDFGNVPYIASVELGSLINLHKKMRASGGRLTLTNVRPEIFEIFVLTNLHTYMDVRQGEAA